MILTECKTGSLDRTGAFPFAKIHSMGIGSPEVWFVPPQPQLTVDEQLVARRCGSRTSPLDTANQFMPDTPASHLC